MNAALCSVLLAAVLASSVNAHGQMTEPKPRPVTDAFRAAAGALKNAGNDELQWAPLENLSQRKQKDFPEAATFDIMNGCRGMVYEASNPVTALQAGVAFPVKWYIQAPHPGYAEFSIVKPKTGAGGKISYEKVALLKRIEDFAKTGGNDGTTLTIPSSVTGCEKAGACALQMYWHSDIANQTYPTCADITVGGSGAATGDDSSSTTPAKTSRAPAKTTKPAAATPTPAVTSEYNDDDAAGDSDKTPAATPSPTKKACKRRLRK